MHITTDHKYLEARAIVYRLLAPLFLTPDPDQYELVRSGRYAEDLTTALTALDLPGRIICRSNELLAEMEAISYDDWQDEFARVFGHTMSKDSPPYETQYGAAHVFMQTQDLAALSAFYQSFGLDLIAGIERVDHITVEMEFVSFLYVKEAVALTAYGDGECRNLVKMARECFLRNHLRKWAPAFCRLLEKKAGYGIYHALARLTGSWLRWDLDLNQIAEPDPIEVALRPAGSDFLSLDCVSCPMQTTA